jgi:hypothetical protein
MKNTIFTIPISEAFEPECGCPICNIKNMLEKRYVEYIMGAAMMECDVRKQTNEMGFCEKHFDKLLGAKNRLSLALMLKSRLEHIEQEEYKIKKNKNENCFVCYKIDEAMNSMVSNMFNVYSHSKEFRELFARQQVFCYSHYNMLSEIANKKLKKDAKMEFLNSIKQTNKKYNAQLYKDICDYCNSYDYRNASDPIREGQTKDSIERAIAFLTNFK